MQYRNKQNLIHMGEHNREIFTKISELKELSERFKKLNLYFYTDENKKLFSIYDSIDDLIENYNILSLSQLLNSTTILIYQLNPI